MSGGKTALGLDLNVGALVCYLNICIPAGLIYSIIVLVTDKTNKLPRFHAMQSILLSVVGTIILIPVYIITIGLALSGSSMMALLATLLWLVMAVVGLGLLVFVVLSAIKAYNGEVYKIPFIGDYADKFSN